MKRFKTWKWIFALMAVSFVSLPVWAGAPSQFTADLVQTRKGVVTKGKLTVMGSRYAWEQKQGDEVIQVVVDTQANLTRVMVPKDKSYLEMPSDKLRSVAGDPFQAVRAAAARYDSAKVGEEKIDGRTCEKIVISSGGHKLMTEWVAKGLGFPVKIITHGKYPRVMEVKNIRTGPVDESVFTVPADYQRMEPPPGPRRAASASVKPGLSTSVRGTAPMGRRLSPGGELRVGVKGGRPAKVVVKNLIAGKTTILVLPFRSGKQVENIGVKPTELTGRGDMWDREFNTSLNVSKSFMVDELVIRAEKGLAVVWVEQKDKAARDYFNPGNMTTWISLKDSAPVSVTITGDNQDAAESKVVMSEVKKAGGSVRRELTLKNGQSKSWKYPAGHGLSRIQVTVRGGEGMVKIHVDQSGGT
ncbi:MAG: DUF4412 domain-containing protein [Acidobacteriota bacterium]